MALNRQSRRVFAALRKLEKPIADAFKAAIERAAFQVDFSALVAAIDAQDIGAAVDLLRIDPASLFPIDEGVRSAFIEGGNLVAGDLQAGLSGTFSFNGRQERAEAWVRQNAGQLIQGITEESMQSVRRVIQQGINTGRPSSVLAREITGRVVGRRRVGGFLGLTTEIADSVERARAILSDPDEIRRYYIRDRQTGRMKPRFRLSDRRYDARIKQAIREGRAMSGRDLAEIIQAHRTKALGYRGRVIAKDQSFTALAAGRAEGYQQLLDNPNVEKVTKRWQHNLSQNPREDHVAMDGTVIEFDDYFRFDDALMKNPHDPAGGAEHSIGCRCVAIYRAVMRRGNRPPATGGGIAPTPPARTPDPTPAPPPVPPVATPPQAPEPVTAPPFYEQFQGTRSVAAAEAYLRDNGIAENADLKGIAVSNVTEALQRAGEMKARFNLQPLGYMGPVTRDTRFRYRRVRGANAAVFATTRALHLPTKFGNLKDAQQQREVKARRSAHYTAQRDAIIARNPRVTDEVKDRIARMQPGDYTWTIPSESAGAERAKTMVHEYGHVLHKIDPVIGPRIDRFLQSERPLQSGWQYLVSKYGGENVAEYIAETFTIYITKPESEHFRIHPKLLEIYRQADANYDS